MSDNEDRFRALAGRLAVVYRAYDKADAQFNLPLSTRANRIARDIRTDVARSNLEFERVADYAEMLNKRRKRDRVPSRIRLGK